MPYELSGTVMDGGSPVEGAVVVVVRQSTDEVAGTDTTDESGAWSVGGLDLATYDAYVRVDGKTAPAMTGVVPTEVAVAPAITITTPVEPLEVGQTRQLAVSVTGSPTPVVTYQSDDEAVATVDGDGLVTAVAEGECTITATATNSEGQDSDTYALEVEAADEPGGDIILFDDLTSHSNGPVNGLATPVGDYEWATTTTNMQVVDGAVQLLSGSPNRLWFEPSMPTADYRFEADLRAPHVSTLLVRKTVANSFGAGGAVEASYSSSGFWRIRDDSQEIASGPAFSMPDDGFVTVALEVEGSAARLYVDDVLQCEGAITTQLAAGYIGIGYFEPLTHAVSRVRVTAL